MSGAPRVTGTRVPVQDLSDYLAGGDPLDVFLADFPGVTRAQAEAVIALAGRNFVDGLSRAWWGRSLRPSQPHGRGKLTAAIIARGGVTSRTR